MEQQVVRFDQVLDRIRAFAAWRGWKPARLAREAGLSDTVTRDMERDDWTPSGGSVRKIEALIPGGWQPGDPLQAEATADDASPASTAAESGRPA